MTRSINDATPEQWDSVTKVGRLAHPSDAAKCDRNGNAKIDVATQAVAQRSRKRRHRNREHRRRNRVGRAIAADICKVRKRNKAAADPKQRRPERDPSDLLPG